MWSSLRVRLRAAREELDETLRALRRERVLALRDERRVARQEELRENVRRAGWCLGLLGAAQGIDLLRARREPEGLRWLSAALAEPRALELTPVADELPLLDGSALACLELPLLCAWCVLCSGDTCGGSVRWSASLTPQSALGDVSVPPRRQLVFELGVVREPAELAARCTRLSSADPHLPQLALVGARLRLAWLQERGACGADQAS